MLPTPVCEHFKGSNFNSIINRKSIDKGKKKVNHREFTSDRKKVKQKLKLKVIS